MQSKATSLNLYYFIAHRAKVQTNPQNLTISSQQSWGQKQHNPPHVEGGCETSGSALLSQGASPQVPSARVGLTGRVRNGNGCLPTAIATARNSRSTSLTRSTPSRRKERARVTPSPRPISTGRLNTLLCLHLRPINVIVSHGPYQVNPVGNLILKRASRLYAFSAYPFRRSLTSHALGRTTGTRELRPSRSSRTRDSLSQVSYGCIG